MFDAQHHGHNQILNSQIRSHVLNKDFASNYNYGTAQSVNSNIKSGHERVGNPENSNLYVCWLQQCVFIGADRRRVRYEELTQSQWTAGLTTMAAQETNLLIQRNMFTFIASLL